jgi:hypothetical protein
MISDLTKREHQAKMKYSELGGHHTERIAFVEFRKTYEARLSERKKLREDKKKQEHLDAIKTFQDSLMESQKGE